MPKKQPWPEKVLVCALASDEFMIPGSVFKYVCSRCGRLCMTAPSGQTRLRKDPDTAIVCGDCMERKYCEMKRSGEKLPKFEVATTKAEVFKEASSAVPNFWKKRN